MVLIVVALTGKSFVIGNAALADWPIIYCNESFISLFGWTRTDVIGRPVTCTFLYGDATDGEVIQNFRLGVQEREEYECEVVLYTKSGKRRPCMCASRDATDAHNLTFASPSLASSPACDLPPLPGSCQRFCVAVAVIHDTDMVVLMFERLPEAATKTRKLFSFRKGS